jgi:hypothetical protein
MWLSGTDGKQYEIDQEVCTVKSPSKNLLDHSRYKLWTEENLKWSEFNIGITDIRWLYDKTSLIWNKMYVVCLSE